MSEPKTRWFDEPITKHRVFRLKDGTMVEYIETARVRSRIITSPCGAQMEGHAYKGTFMIPRTGRLV